MYKLEAVLLLNPQRKHRTVSAVCVSKVFDLNILYYIILTHKKQLLTCLGASDACDYSNECLRNVNCGMSPEIPGGHKENDQSAKQKDSVWIFQAAVACEVSRPLKCRG